MAAKIDKRTVEKIAELSKLEFDENGKAAIADDLNRILGFIDQLEALDTQSVEPLIFMNESYNILREDIAVETITHEEALKNAPEKDSDYFRVPKVLNKKG